MHNLGQKIDSWTAIPELKVDPILMQVLLTSNIFFLTAKKSPFAVWLPKTLEHKVLYSLWASFILFYFALRAFHDDAYYNYAKQRFGKGTNFHSNKAQPSIGGPPVPASLTFHPLSACDIPFKNTIKQTTIKYTKSSLNSSFSTKWTISISFLVLGLIEK